MRRDIRLAWSIVGAMVLAAMTVGSVGAQDDDMLTTDASLRRSASFEIDIPPLDPTNGRILFATKGCVICHAVNGVGGRRGKAPPLDASRMPSRANPFEFSALMWRGAEKMIDLQKEDFNYRIDITAQELGDIFAFVHDAEEQKLFIIPGRPGR